MTGVLNVDFGFKKTLESLLLRKKPVVLDLGAQKKSPAASFRIRWRAVADKGVRWR